MERKTEIMELNGNKFADSLVCVIVLVLWFCSFVILLFRSWSLSKTLEANWPEQLNLCSFSLIHSLLILNRTGPPPSQKGFQMPLSGLVSYCAALGASSLFLSISPHET